MAEQFGKKGQGLGVAVLDKVNATGSVSCQNFIKIRSAGECSTAAEQETTNLSHRDTLTTRTVTKLRDFEPVSRLAGCNSLKISSGMVHAIGTGEYRGSDRTD
ncbi:hypothetical protein AAFN60_07075 [Roseibacillus persicicus]|uniref:hypothetical protein n=1 Tax=Roseibacillus persicicus TaxID=454148 RepID=UPI00398A9A45